MNQHVDLMRLSEHDDNRDLEASEPYRPRHSSTALLPRVPRRHDHTPRHTMKE
jgi:hypothetical protein